MHVRDGPPSSRGRCIGCSIFILEFSDISYLDHILPHLALCARTLPILDPNLKRKGFHASAALTDSLRFDSSTKLAATQEYLTRGTPDSRMTTIKRLPIIVLIHSQSGSHPIHHNPQPNQPYYTTDTTLLGSRHQMSTPCQVEYLTDRILSKVKGYSDKKKLGPKQH